MIKEKLDYCLGCKVKPCTKGCPLTNDITDIIKLLKEGKEEEAYLLLSETSVLPSVCGRICPHEKQCQGKCVRGIKSTPVQIGSIDAYLGDLGLDKWPYSVSNNVSGKVAVIGGGPAGLTCAAFLRREGIDVTIYEKHNELGGILAHGIPEFRLDRDILSRSINKIINMGIKVELNKEAGKDFSIDELLNEYDAVFVGVGANISRKMNIPGEDLYGVFGANETLEYKDFADYSGKTVVVSGAGNVAMDISRTLKAKGAERVIIVYRRSEAEMPAEVKEVSEAKEEGIEFMLQTNILEILGDNKCEKLHCIKTELVQKEGDSRLSPVNIAGSDFELPCDYIYMAVGSEVSKEVLDFPVAHNKWNQIEVDENYRTSNPKVYAGGDIISGKATVAYACKYGRDAAKTIIEDLKNAR